ncbi:DUF6207 family protein [Streptomyces sp. DT193]|uniref:DUF6207 family protein n=1 Tax=Streptomyces sp. DT193 TaxID=3393418 RepID=UPI003CEA95C4
MRATHDAHVAEPGLAVVEIATADDATAFTLQMRANRCADGRPADPYEPQDMLPRHTVPGAGVRPVRR